MTIAQALRWMKARPGACVMRKIEPPPARQYLFDSSSGAGEAISASAFRRLVSKKQIIPLQESDSVAYKDGGSCCFHLKE